MNPMNILVLSHHSPLPENHGFAQRVLSQARALARRGHTVSIVAPASDRGLKAVKRTVPFPELETLELVEVPVKERMARPVRSLVERFFPWQDSPAILKEALKVRLSMKPDIVQLERPFLLSTARMLKKLGTPLVLVEHLVEQDAAVDLKARGEYSDGQVRATVATERTAVELADLTLAVSREDARVLEDYYGGGIGGLRPTIEVAPNGVECDAYKDVAPYKFPKPAVLFLGSGFHYPNRDAMWRLANQIIPEVQKHYRTMDFVFMGPNPPDWLKSRQNVRVLGDVQDIRPYVLGASVCVAPLRLGTGTPIKMLEYMAAGKAMVASPHASRTFHLRDGEHALVRSSVADFAEAIVKLTRDEALARSLGRAAYALCREQYDWSVLVKDIERKYERFLA